MTSVVDLAATRDERVLVWGRSAAEAQYCVLNDLSLGVLLRTVEKPFKVSLHSSQSYKQGRLISTLVSAISSEHTGMWPSKAKTTAEHQ